VLAKPTAEAAPGAAGKKPSCTGAAGGPASAVTVGASASGSAAEAAGAAGDAKTAEAAEGASGPAMPAGGGEGAGLGLARGFPGGLRRRATEWPGFRMSSSSACECTPAPGARSQRA
jgi:hypothetical protein